MKCRFCWFLFFPFCYQYICVCVYVCIKPADNFLFCILCLISSDSFTSALLVKRTTTTRKGNKGCKNPTMCEQTTRTTTTTTNFYWNHFENKIDIQHTKCIQKTVTINGLSVANKRSNKLRFFFLSCFCFSTQKKKKENIEFYNEIFSNLI